MSRLCKRGMCKSVGNSILGRSLSAYMFKVYCLLAHDTWPERGTTKKEGNRSRVLEPELSRWRFERHLFHYRFANSRLQSLPKSTLEWNNLRLIHIPHTILDILILLQPLHDLLPRLGSNEARGAFHLGRVRIAFFDGFFEHCSCGNNSISFGRLSCLSRRMTGKDGRECA